MPRASLVHLSPRETQVLFIPDCTDENIITNWFNMRVNGEFLADCEEVADLIFLGLPLELAKNVAQRLDDAYGHKLRD